MRAAVLVVTTVATGLMAGVFAIYANAIMPGLRRTDDRTFVGAFQAVDRAIINPLFLATFMLPVFGTGAAALLHLADGERDALPWCAAAFALYLFVFVSTVRVNVPRNDALKAAGEPDAIADLGAVRKAFDEHRWARWNLARALANTASFACLLGALVARA